MTWSALLPGLDLRPHLNRVNRTGVAFVPAALTESCGREILRAAETLSLVAPPEDAIPRANASLLAVLRNDSTEPAVVGRLREEITHLVRQQGESIPGLAQWRPNETFIRTYAANSTGMNPHQDGRRFRYLVATFTLRGRAMFVSYDESGRVVEKWPTAPGCLVLIRGPGLDEIPDGRPVHAVGGPEADPRCSIAFRMHHDAQGT